MNLMRNVMEAMVIGAAVVGLSYILNRPKSDNVEQGFVVPSKLEIDVKDLSKSGKNQTLLNYNGKSYLFKLDTNGVPTAVPYQLIPSKVVPLSKGNGGH